MMSFSEYLKPYRVKKGERFTHSGIDSFKGRFCIPEDQTDAFWRNYYNHVYKLKLSCDLIEKHDTVCCLLYDLDLNISPDTGGKRTYDDKMIYEFIRCVTKVASKYIAESSKSWDCFVFEKAKASVKKDYLKDGIHFMFPNIVTKPAVQYLIRDELLAELEMIGLFDNPDILNNIEDIVDKSVIDKNGWMMLGSNKPNGLPYTLTGHYSYNDNNEFTNLEPRKRQNSRWYKNSIDLLKECSIRNYNIPADIASFKDDMKDIVEDFTNTYNNNKKKVNSKKYHNDIIKGTHKTDLSTIRELVTILDKKRAESYIPWIELGWCLINLSEGTSELLQDWIEFSKRSECYEKTAEEDCTKQWEKDNKIGADCKGVGTLHMWAKQDNPDAYMEIIKKSLDHLICKVVKSSLYEKGVREKKRPEKTAFVDLIYNIVRVLKHKYGHVFYCTNYDKRIWYRFSGIRWNKCDGDVEMRKVITNELRADFLSTSIKYRKLAQSLDSEHHSEHPYQPKYENIAKDLKIICSKLRETNFKKKIMEEAIEQLWWHDNDVNFEDMLDTKNNLVGLQDGVYDLNEGEFRQCRCDDYLSLSTKNNWKQYSWDDPLIINLQNFLTQIMPEEEERDYLMRCMSSFLSGDLKGEFFHIWVGEGGNGKSKLMELLRLTMGDYWATLDVSSLTQKRSSSEKAKPEIARLHGKRVVFASEPDGKDRLNMGIIKELTGGDTIAVRQLHKEHKELTVQFNLVLLCNILPKVESDDQGTWRRLKPLPFESSFSENPDPNDKHQHKIDTGLTEKLKLWKEPFFWLLCQYYPEFVKHKYTESPKVLNCMKEYRQSNDDYSDFISECITKTNDPSDILYLDIIFPIYQHWYRQTVDDKTPTRKDFTKAVETNIGKIIVHDGKKVWIGSKPTDIKKSQYLLQ